MHVAAPGLARPGAATCGGYAPSMSRRGRPARYGCGRESKPLEVLR
jgi:hypothetical protein